MGPMLGCEGFSNRQGRPEAHLHAGQVQFPGNNQTITAVMPGSHQHKRTLIQ